MQNPENFLSKAQTHSAEGIFYFKLKGQNLFWLGANFRWRAYFIHLKSAPTQNNNEAMDSNSVKYPLVFCLRAEPLLQCSLDPEHRTGPFS